MKSLLLHTLVVLLLNLSDVESSSAAQLSVHVDWTAVQAMTPAIPTFLDQVNPSMSRTSYLHDPLFGAMKNLGADRIRYLHWFPFPTISNPEPSPPTKSPCKTSWNFTLIDEYVVDFMNATAGHDSVINFSPIPFWMMNATGPLDPSGKQIGEYFNRIISWYTKGGFVDECGVKHVSSHHYKWKYWEVLNEPDLGSIRCPKVNLTCAQTYTRLYDGIASTIAASHPHIQFTGLVLSGGGDPNNIYWFEYFLNSSNHLPGVPVDSISYHLYAAPSGSVSTFGPQVYDACVNFMSAAKGIQSVVNRLAPHVVVNVNEIGVIPANGGCPLNSLFGAARSFWNVAAVMYAYMYAKLAAIGVDIMAASQIDGYPAGYWGPRNFPCVSMVDYNNGEYTARWWSLLVIREQLGSLGMKKLLNTTVDGGVAGDGSSGGTPSLVFAQAFQLDDGHRALLLGNFDNVTHTVALPETVPLNSTRVYVVDLENGHGNIPYSNSTLESASTDVTALAVVLLTW